MAERYYLSDERVAKLMQETAIHSDRGNGLAFHPRTQHAKLAGNSIVVACLYYIFRNLFVSTEPEAGTQTKLF